MTADTSRESTSCTGSDHLHRGGVACIVLNWNGLDRTRACYHAVMPLLEEGDRLMIVDNGSTEHDAATLQAQCPDALVLDAGRNLGFAGGVNLAISRLLDESPEIAYIWLLNNDMLVMKETLAALLAAITHSAHTGIVGADMPDGSWRLSKLLRMPIPAHGSRSPDYVSGACMLIRRDVFADIGLFDDGFFFFFEDADFCLRTRAAGWRLAIAEGAKAKHAGGATIRRDPAARARHYRAGHRRFLRKTARAATLRAAVCLLWRLLADAAAGQTAAIRGNLAGWREGREPIQGAAEGTPCDPQPRQQSALRDQGA